MKPISKSLLSRLIVELIARFEIRRNIKKKKKGKYFGITIVIVSIILIKAWHSVKLLYDSNHAAFP